MLLIGKLKADSVLFAVTHTIVNNYRENSRHTATSAENYIIKDADYTLRLLRRDPRNDCIALLYYLRQRSNDHNVLSIAMKFSAANPYIRTTLACPKSWPSAPAIIKETCEEKPSSERNSMKARSPPTPQPESEHKTRLIPTQLPMILISLT